MKHLTCQLVIMSSAELAADRGLWLAMFKFGGSGEVMPSTLEAHSAVAPGFPSATMQRGEVSKPRTRSPTQQHP